MILVTGGYGCIGAELIKWLLRNTDEEILLGSRAVTLARTERTFHDVDRGRLTCVEFDVSDQEAVRDILSANAITRIAHLAALQTPDCNEHRALGLRVNLGGTQNLIEAIKESPQGVRRFVFASSIAVYGPRASYPEQQVPMLAQPQPVNVYGTWKLAGEQISGFLHEDTGVPTICLRPGVLYGPGRDAGLTSTPTTAMKCVVLGRPYEIPFKNRQDYLYAPDVGAAFGCALIEPFDGFGVFTLPSHTVGMQSFVDLMQKAACESGLRDQFAVTFGEDEVPFICDLEYEPFMRTFPQTPHTDLAVALHRSLLVFKEHAANGWLCDTDIS